MAASRQISILAAAGGWLLVASPAWAVLNGQIDTFEDGTTRNWVVGILGGPHPAPPVNVPTGGPDGLDDNFLLLTSVGGAGAGSRLSVINLDQWSGDYIAAGVTGIRMDLYNLGGSDLSLRLLFADPAGGPPSNLAFSTDAVLLPAGGGWTSVLFPIAPSELTAGLGSVVDALTGATEMRIFHNPDPSFFPPTSPPAIAAQLGVDNIQAVPEPSTLALFALGSLIWVPWVRRQRRSAASGTRN